MRELWRVMVVMSTAAGGCAVNEVDTSTAAQAGTSLQGTSLQGTSLQGTSLQGTSLQGFALGSINLTGQGLQNARVERGELVAELAGQTLRGTQLIGAHLAAQVHRTSDPEDVQEVEYRITAIVAESSAYDPTHTGNTYLYTLEQWVDDTGSWVPACPTDGDGRSAAIPLAATWNDHGERIASPGMFTFGCTTGVIAKCYRWGYRPWVTGYGGDLADMHWACTRMARADYCGDGTSHTHDGTWINMWDRLPAPGPIQKHGLLPPLGMVFEAGWDTGGAVCLSTARWLIDDGLEIAQLCPDRLVPPGLLGATVCDTVAGVLLQQPAAKLFNEAYININLPGIELSL